MAQAMQQLLVIGSIALGGAVGAVARALVAGRVAVMTSWPSWAGTLMANAIGCIGIGFAWVWLEQRGHPQWLRAFLITGILGAFTTFSTYAIDAMHLIDERRLGTALAYLVGSVVVGLVAVKTAMLIAHRLL